MWQSSRLGKCFQNWISNSVSLYDVWWCRQPSNYETCSIRLATMNAWNLLYSYLYVPQRYIAVSFNKCSHCKSFWIKASDKCPKCQCEWGRLFIVVAASRPPRRVHGSIGPPDRLRQRPRGPAGAGARPLLHARRPGGIGGPTGQRRRQVPRRGRPADVAVAPWGVAVRQHAGKRGALFIPGGVRNEELPQLRAKWEEATVKGDISRHQVWAWLAIASCFTIATWPSSSGIKSGECPPRCMNTRAVYPPTQWTALYRPVDWSSQRTSRWTFPLVMSL